MSSSAQPRAHGAPTPPGRELAGGRLDGVLTTLALALTGIAAVSLVIVVVMGLLAPPAPAALTWTAMIGFPLAVITIATVIVRAVLRRRSA